MTGPLRPAVALAMALFAATLPVLARMRDRRLARALGASLALKLVVAIASEPYYLRRYGRENDAYDYHQAGAAIADGFRRRPLRETVVMARMVPFDTERRLPTGTNFIRLLVAAVYGVTGPSLRAVSVAFAWFGFWGQFLFVRAFTVAVPDGRRGRYSRLVLFAPSIVFWGSIVGKEAWMLLSFGIGALGGARLATGARRSGLRLLALGGAMTMLVRSHIPRILGGGFRANMAAAQSHTAAGASAFTPPPLEHVGDVPRVVASALLRPHPLEAHNAVTLAAAAETTALAALAIAVAPELPRTLAQLHRRPYVAFSAVAAGVLALLMGQLANFGALVRQRTPALPFLLVLLAAAPRRNRG